MGTVELVARFHVAEPSAGTIRAADGRQGDPFRPGDYPLRAVCRVCGEPVQSSGFLQPFTHFEDEEPQL